jgi:hypothetical protein
MGFQRAVSIGAMRAASSSNDFLTSIIPQLPTPQVPGALPAMTRELNAASRVLMPMDVVIVWGIGDFGATYSCSSYYDPSSPWYNVFYGLYAMRSYKSDGSAWGYTNKGQPNFDEFLQLAAVDYNYLTGAQFGCPPNMMCFSATSTLKGSDNGWDVADVTAQIPSGLHDPTQHAANPGNYLAFGIPDPSFLNGRSSYEPVQMCGRFYMRRLSVPAGTPPSTLAWGTACPNTNAGRNLRETIMQALGKVYLQLGSSHGTGSP